MTLFQECIDVLGEDITIYSEEDTSKLFSEFASIFPITSWGQVDWIALDDKITDIDLSSLVKMLKRRGLENLTVIVLWNYSDAPAIRANLENILINLNDVIAVGSDTFLFSPENRFVIEFHHEGEITLGFL